jgi:hypothetical protein
MANTSQGAEERKPLHGRFRLWLARKAALRDTQLVEGGVCLRAGVGPGLVS